MNEFSDIYNRTVAFWKSKGFSFAPAVDAVSCTQVTHASGKPFRYFLTRRLPTIAHLLRDFNREVCQSCDNKLIVAGEYDGEAEFPFFLLTQESFEEMQRAHHRYCAAMLDAQKNQGEFINALFYLQAPHG